MRLARLKPGDRIEADVRGRKFLATVKNIHRGYASVEPDDPRAITWRFLSARRIARKVA